MSAGVSRRAFLARTAGAGLTAAGLGPLIASCGASAGAVPPKHLRLPAPNHPITWPVHKANPPIRSGLAPERRATLKVYTWTGRVSPRCLNDFASAYGCEIELTTFTTLGQAMTALQGRHGTFDVLLGAPSSIIGRLVWPGLIQPLNHGYIPNLKNAWPFFANPYYDTGWKYTVPYTVYTTGIAWRRDLIHADPYALTSGWDDLWTAGRQAGHGKVAILDDYRSAIGLALLRNRVKDLNTTDPLQINTAARALINLGRRTGLRITNTAATDLASGRVPIRQAWSGQVAAAAQHLPKGVPADVLGYWFPPDGAGPVANDTGTVLRGAQNPVLAHLLLNYLLDGHHALTNIARTGFVQPLTYVTPSRLVFEGILPKSLTTTCVLSTYLDHSLKELQLPVASDLLWRQAWQAVSHPGTCVPNFC